MKKIFIILLCMITLNANATEMCARNDTVVIPLDSTITSNTGGHNQIEMLFWIQFTYGMLYGNAACLSKKEVMMYSNWNGTGTPPLLNTSSDELVGSHGYYMNADTNPDIPDSEKLDYRRDMCFCQITHPMRTQWLYVHNYPGGDCYGVYQCQYHCAQLLSSGHDNIGKRKALFNSIGTVPPWTE